MNCPIMNKHVRTWRQFVVASSHAVEQGKELAVSLEVLCKLQSFKTVSLTNHELKIKIANLKK